MESLIGIVQEFDKTGNAKRFVFRIMKLFKVFDVELICWVVSVLYRISNRWVGGDFNCSEVLMIFCLIYGLDVGLFLEECYSQELIFRSDDLFFFDSVVRR
jgi:hypothetical protein